MTTITRQTVYFTVAKRFDGVDVRCGPAYATRKSAQAWVPFVRKSWRGFARVRVLACLLRWVNGKLDEASIARLDKFNMDPPAEDGDDLPDEPGG